MQNRFALIIASAAALLVLMAGIGLALRWNGGPVVDAGVTPLTSGGSVQAGPVSDQPSIDQQLQSLIDSREASCRQALNDANSKVEQANAQLKQAYAVIDALKQGSAQTAAAPTGVPQPAQQTQQDQAAQVVQAPGYAVSPDEAATIALVIEPGGRLIKAPTLVSFQGTPAYEVKLDVGTLYVDANSRSVLYDGAAPAQLSGGNPSNREYEEHDGGGGDD